MRENNKDISKIEADANRLLNEGKTVLYFADESNIIGIIAVSDCIKDTSYEGIQELKKRNINVIMVTGDNKIVSESVGRKLGIDEVISEVLPQDKERKVSELQKQGKKVAFVGDGINDSPALMKSDVGIGIASGTDIAIESADVILMKNSLLDIVSAIDLSKAVIKNIKMNLFWAFFYNAIGIPVASGVFYTWLGLKLNPMIGALAMSLSSVCVVTNALRLKNFKTHYKGKEDKKYMSEYVKTIKIEGMHCNHCKMTVEKTLKEFEGVKSVEVDLAKKIAVMKSDRNIDEKKLKEVIKDEGFEVKEIK